MQRWTIVACMVWDLLFAPPHQCQYCNVEVDHCGLHGLSCKKRVRVITITIPQLMASFIGACHLPRCPQDLNHLVSTAQMVNTQMGSPWSHGKPLIWDATCPDTLAQSYHAHATRGTGAVAAMAEEKKELNTSASLEIFLWPKVLDLPEGSWKENQKAHWGREGTSFSVPAINSGSTDGECPCNHGCSGRQFKPGQPILGLINFIA